MGSVLKSALKWVAEQLFGELISSFFGSFINDFAIKLIWFVLVGTGVVFFIWAIIIHFSTPKCKHKRRGVCYQCDPIEPY